MFIPPDLQNYKYDIYLRRSSDDADHQIASLPSQKEVLTRLRKENGLKVSRIVEESKSAKQPGRPVFNEDIKRLEEGIIQGLIVWDLSRASRNPVDSGTLSWLLQKEILKAIITPHRIYLPQDNVLLLNVEFGMANQFLRDLSKNVKRGLQNKLNKGQRPGVAPEGYKNDNSKGKGNSENIVDELRFPLVRKMWDLLLTGSYTVPQILKIANEEWGYRTRKHRKTGGMPLSRSGLYRIFTNTFYFGDYQYGGKWCHGEHKPMITPQEYDRVQFLLGRKGKQRPSLREFAFTGMIRCKGCGAMVTAEVKTNRYGTQYIYYHCTRRKTPKCTQKSIEIGELQRQIDEILSKTDIPEVFKDWAIQYLNELHDRETKEQTVINESVDKAYADCITQINNLIKLKISPLNKDNSILSDEDYQKQMTDLQKEKRTLESQKKTLGERVEKWEKLSRETYNFACYARYHFHYGTLHEKREILQTIGSNFFLQNQKLYLDIPRPYVIMEKSKKEVDRILSTFEPEEKKSLTPQIAALFDQSSTLRRGRDSNPRYPCGYISFQD